MKASGHHPHGGIENASSPPAISGNSEFRILITVAYGASPRPLTASRADGSAQILGCSAAEIQRISRLESDSVVPKLE